MITGQYRYRFLYDIARPYRGRLLLAVVLTMVFTAGTLAPPMAMRYLIDHVVQPGHWQLLLTAVALITFLPITNVLVAMANRLVIGALGQRIVADLRTGFYRHVLSLTMHFHSEMGAGPIMSRLMTDVGVVQNLVTGETLGIVSSVVALFFAAGMAFTLNWKLALVMMCMVSLYAINYYKFAQRIRNANLELREIMDLVTGRLQERLAGVRLVKTYCRERDETDEFLASTDRALQYGMRGAMLSVSLSSTARMIGGLGSTVIYCCAAYAVLKGEMTYGSLYALDNYVWLAINPAVNLTMVAGTVTQAFVSLDRILEVLQQQSNLREKPGAYDLPAVRGDLRLEGVGFGYAEKPLLRDFSLHLPAGKMTALVGHTGCGKTTVTSLLLRLWDVQEGCVTLDGHDVRDLTIRTLRHHLGVVPQEPVVFEGTVFENIAYAQPDATLAEVEEAARAAQMHAQICALPDGYQTWLGKDGAKFSVGEKQRIAIARAILRKPAVLILDEATSALDSESEAALQQAMRTVLHGRTSVVVAHRLSTIVEADQIVALSRGRIVEIGTHDELVAREGGYYRRLYEELKGQHGEVNA